ncbi:hypothetical protein NDU88_007302 [Pleurodeles waltl]|uniref:Uncharacterized protein n=1 Tax=Pleurodeles waltl TaxID=8319 RepID=A0AAV7LT87_PLEWA|nr:hypothetical protein NDU88_007302 [Pleurodeles waltl]
MYLTRPNASSPLAAEATRDMQAICLGSSSDDVALYFTPRVSGVRLRHHPTAHSAPEKGLRSLGCRCAQLQPGSRRSKEHGLQQLPQEKTESVFCFAVANNILTPKENISGRRKCHSRSLPGR